MPARRPETNLGAFAPAEPSVSVPVRTVPEAPPSRSVTEVVAAIRRRLAEDPDLASLWVRGEVSGFTAHSSGHWYFTLKDEGAVLPAVMWRSANGRVKFRPEEGMEVLVRGRIDLYAARGAVQLVAEELRPVGAGELAVRFEQLRRKLEGEGLFATQRKRPLPRFPRTVGIVTSLHAAALRDMLRVATARHPGVRLLVANARVQGEGAAEEIAAAIGRMNARDDVDVLIVGRGGGSAEDLWAFNEEVVVRAVAASRIPVVSAVGHETDYTLCDFAADLRAATPSNACEIVVPDAHALRRQLDECDARMRAALGRLVPDLRQRIDELERRAGDGVRRTLSKERDLLAAHAARLDALSPLAVLARGYAVARKPDGRAVRSVADVREGDDVRITLRDGDVQTKVTGRKPHDADR
ncbi:MAG TPA: exodeoxyribonuclease VII large subunit [Candidatus Thermoplasmatota archaeon]|nr:exodeoxyribonuclease VII large subunit [Candidatus Thermoplasmatota archaeon]